MLFLSCFKGFGGITLSKSSPACFFTPGYTKFCVFWCYERRVMAKIRFDMLANVVEVAYFGHFSG